MTVYLSNSNTVSSHRQGTGGGWARRLAYRIGVASLLLVYLVWPKAYAQDKPRWSVSTVFGVHDPVLTDLSQGLYRSPLLGNGSVGEATANTDSIQDFRFEQPLPKVGIGAKAGLEFQWRPNARHALVFGIGSWEKTSISRFQAEIPTQAALNRVNVEHRAKISYTEYNIGWRHFIWRRPGFNLYTRLAINELFDLDYREDHVFFYVSGSGLAGFRRIMIVEAQTASLFLGQLAVGGEWFLREWFSLSFEGGYLVAQGQGRLGHVRTRTDFVDRSDRISLATGHGLPYGVLPDGTLGYLPADATLADVNSSTSLYKPVKLDFGGWQLSFRISVYL